MKIKKYEDFINDDKQNEGIKSWLSTALLLVNLGFLSAKDLENKTEDVDGTFIKNIPLYNISFDINGANTTISTTDLTGKIPNVNVNVNVKNKYYIGFMTNPLFTTFNLGFKF